MTDRPYTFDHIPSLDELIKRPLGGYPGMEYLQVCTQNTRKAEDEGWRRVPGSVAYSIVTSKGVADMVLYQYGTPIRGASHLSGKCVCLVDNEVEALTGLSPAPKKESKDVKVKEPAKASGEAVQVGA
jgi:hypothetical protein